MASHTKLILAIVFALGFVSALTAVLLTDQIQFEDKQYCALGVETIFSPDSQEEFVSIIDSSQQTLDVMLYQFSNPAMQDALANAVKRGVKVRIILEPRVDSNYATAEILSQNGVEVKFASRDYTNTHSKTAVIDGAKVLVGSTNWSRQAVNSNRESAVLIESVSLAQEFERVFGEDWVKAKDFVPSTQS